MEAPIETPEENVAVHVGRIQACSIATIKELGLLIKRLHALGYEPPLRTGISKQDLERAGIVIIEEAQAVPTVERAAEIATDNNAPAEAHVSVSDLKVIDHSGDGFTIEAHLHRTTALEELPMPTQEAVVEEPPQPSATELITSKLEHAFRANVMRGGVGAYGPGLANLKQYTEDVLLHPQHKTRSWPSGFYRDSVTAASQFHLNVPSMRMIVPNMFSPKLTVLIYLPTPDGYQCLNGDEMGADITNFVLANLDAYIDYMKQWATLMDKPA